MGRTARRRRDARRSLDAEGMRGIDAAAGI